MINEKVTEHGLDHLREKLGVKNQSGAEFTLKCKSHASTGDTPQAAICRVANAGNQETLGLWAMSGCDCLRLQQITGIGPSTAAFLHEQSIFVPEQVAQMQEAEFSRLLDEAGGRVTTHNRHKILRAAKKLVKESKNR